MSKSSIGPYQVLPLWVRVDLGAMTMKGYSPNLQAWSLTIGWFNVISGTFIQGGVLPLYRDALVYYTALAN